MEEVFRFPDDSIAEHGIDTNHAALSILHIINVRWYNACAYYASALASAQRKIGHNVELAGDPGIPSVGIAEEHGVPFNEKPRFSSYFPPGLLANMLWLKKKIGSGINVVVVHRGEAHVAAMLTKRILRADFVLVRVRGDVRPPRNDIFNRILYGPATDAVVCSTEILRRKYLDIYKLNPERVVTIPAGIDIEYYGKTPGAEECKREYGIPDGKLVVTLLGRLSPIKGHELFIKAAGRVIREFTDTHFLIAGEEFEVTEDDLGAMISEYCPGAGFTILGLVDDVRHITGMTDIAVIPSLGSEMIARVALEFMAAGKPIVASNINALAETIDHGAGGFLVEPGDIAGLADAVINLLSDDDKRIKFGDYNKAVAVSRYSHWKWAKDSVEFYRKLIALKEQT
jgi:glycosyltransferase involved in cell wall biosynthesis